MIGMITMPRVSILMNGYNSQKYLKEAIDSVYDQTFQEWEIIFIDNCSTDNTKNIVDSYDEKIKYYKTEKNIPIGAARNFGLKYCTAEYLAFLDTDDIWLKNKLELQVTIMDENSECQFCYGSVIYIDERGSKIGKLILDDESGYLFSKQLKRYEINQQAVVVRNNIYININETLSHSPDFDMFMNIASEYQGRVLSNYLVKYRKHADSLTSKNIGIWGSEMQQTLDKIFQSKPILKEQYPREYNMAYAKVAYNKARYLISINKHKEASTELSKFKFTTYLYFILYIVSLLPSFVWNFIHRYK